MASSLLETRASESSPFCSPAALAMWRDRSCHFGCLASFVAMAVGFASGTAVALALAASLVQLSWNYLPLSGAHHAFQAVLFCLVWADCGAVWSVDAWLARRRDGHVGTVRPPRYPIAPLRLIRVQVALIYLSSGLWKLFNPQWRDGSAVHYVLSNNVYHRFPWGVPQWMEGLTTGRDVRDAVLGVELPVSRAVQTDSPLRSDPGRVHSSWYAVVPGNRAVPHRHACGLHRLSRS